jgi:hypothetical protein
MGSFHELLEEEHRKFCNSLDGQSFMGMMSEISESEEYVSVPKKLLEDLKDFDYWKEWKNNS